MLQQQSHSRSQYESIPRQVFHVGWSYSTHSTQKQLKNDEASSQADTGREVSHVCELPILVRAVVLCPDRVSEEVCMGRV